MMLRRYRISSNEEKKPQGKPVADTPKEGTEKKKTTKKVAKQGGV